MNILRGFAQASSGAVSTWLPSALGTTSTSGVECISNALSVPQRFPTKSGFVGGNDICITFVFEGTASFDNISASVMQVCMEIKVSVFAD